MRVMLCALGLMLAALLHAQSPTVILISMDGLRHDWPALEGLSAFARMRKDGGEASRLTPVYPSNTFPGHVSLATGTYPDVHGIVDNHFIDAVRGVYRMSGDASWLLAEPLWMAAERQGVKAATYFWVGSETDWRGRAHSYRMAPFDGKRPEAAKVGQILEWLTLPEAERPRLIMAYFAGADHVAHDRGPNSSAVVEQLRTQDAALADLLEGIDEKRLWTSLTLMVVSDHGMTAMGDYIDIESPLQDAGIEATFAGTTLVHVHLADAKTLDAARKALSRVIGVKVYSAAEAQVLRIAPDERMGDLIVTTSPPNILTRPAGFDGAVMAFLRFFGWDFGGHGYDPSLPDMGASFLAMGRGVKAGTRFGEVHQVDVAPTVAALLGIEPPQKSEGRAVIDVDVVSDPR
jgi:predicted AlkP superfamily pyrophosphatase or phosphodiesterase